MNLPQLPQDKANHFIYGAVLYLFGLLMFNPMISISIVIIIAAAKELIDANELGTPEFTDFIATIFGGLVWLACSYL